MIGSAVTALAGLALAGVLAAHDLACLEETAAAMLVLAGRCCPEVVSVVEAAVGRCGPNRASCTTGRSRRL